MLQKSAKIAIGRKLKICDIKKIEAILPNIGFHIIKAPNHNNIYTTTRPYKYLLHILYYKNHFMPILDLKAFLGFRFRCKFCGKNTNTHLYQHICKFKCLKCHQNRHNPDLNYNVKCIHCGVEFHSSKCYQDHQHKNIGHHKTVCKMYKYCNVCNYTHKVDAECGAPNSRYCGFCRTKALPNHVCMMVPKNKKKIQKNLFVWDIESRFEDQFYHPDRGVYLKHIPNLIICRKVCALCLDTFNPQCLQCEINTFTGDQCVTNFVKYILEQKQAIVLAHNAAKYDHILIANAVVRLARHRRVTRIPIANSIIAMNIDNTIFFRDTLLFFRIPLKQLPKTFGFNDELEKTPFPYYFNTKENWDYEGPHPSLEYYQNCLEKMSESEKAVFLTWYKENNLKTFNLQKELKKYCLNDVNVLAQAAVIFRQQFLLFDMEVFENVTLSQTAFRVFRDNFMEEDTIQLLTEKKDNTSLLAEKYLYSMEIQEGITLQKAGHPYEYRIPETNYKVDGYHEPTRTCYCFLGCWYHGAPYCDCYSEDEIVVGNQVAGKVAAETKRRLNEISALGYNVVYMSECVWNKHVKDNKLTFPYMPKTLNTRSALTGGRTEVFKIFFSDKLEPRLKAKYLDFNSLYPFVQKSEQFPIGEAEFITGDAVEQDISKYFGAVSCQIEAPYDLKLPVLPTKINGKLLFGLCTKCMNEKNESICRHLSHERDLYGCWVTEEVKLALKFGYKLKKIFQVYHYPEKSDSVFKKYINHFLKLKTQAKGYPANLQTAEDRLKYVQEVEKREGIILDPDQIIFNPGLYFISKIILNSLWGKLCQRSNLKKVETVYTDEAFNVYLSNNKIDIIDIFAIDFSALLVSYEFKAQNTPKIPSQNCILGSFVAAYGRMTLYKALDIIGAKNLLYTDTDSAIFTEQDTEITDRLNELIGIGPYLGMLESELSGDHDYIKTIICLACKSYALLTAQPNKKTGKHTQVKHKGFIINLHDDKEVCNIDSFYNLFKNKTKTLSSTNSNYFVRNPYDSTIFMKHLVKRMKFEYDKRYIVNNVDTLPYGYNGEKH